MIGREFTARLVERVSVLEQEATQVLGELRAMELIYEKTLYPELVYLFKHALTHDVAYESLLKQQRKILHRRVGEVIEDLYASRLAEFYETLAWHYVQGDVWSKAVEYLLKAADKARGRFAYSQATQYCLQATEILAQHGGTSDEKVQTLEKLGDLQSLQGYVEPANQAYDRALAITNESAITRFSPLDFEQAEDYYRQALSLATELGMHSLQAHCHHGLGTLYGKVGRPVLTCTVLWR